MFLLFDCESDLKTIMFLIIIADILILGYFAILNLNMNTAGIKKIKKFSVKV